MNVDEMIRRLQQLDPEADVQIDFSLDAREILGERIEALNRAEYLDEDQLTCRPTDIEVGQHVVTLIVDKEFINY